MELVKSFEEACAKQGYDPATVLPDVSMFPKQHREALISFAKLVIVNEALRVDPKTGEPWIPNWSDTDQYKYYPWFDLELHGKRNPSGFRFGASYCAYGLSTVGSRLVYPTSQIAEYAGTQFEALYKAIMVLP